MAPKLKPYAKFTPTEIVSPMQPMEGAKDKAGAGTLTLKVADPLVAKQPPEIEAIYRYEYPVKEVGMLEIVKDDVATPE